MRARAAIYPRQCGGDGPESPLEHLDSRFEALNRRGNKQILGTAFQEYLLQREDLKDEAGKFDLPLAKRQERFCAEVRQAVEEGTRDISAWFEISERLGIQSTSFPDPIVCGVAGSDTRQLLCYLDMFMNHDASNCSPRGVVNNGLVFLEGINFASPLSPEPEKIPPFSFEHFRTFSAYLEPYFRYFESIVRMGVDFFSSRDELIQAPMLEGKDLEEMVLAIASGQALRHIETDFHVRRRELGEKPDPAGENMLYVAVDPALERMKLPISILGCKLANDTGNCLYAVSKQFRPDNSPLERKLQGMAASAPVVIDIQAKAVTEDVWELRFMDSGNGIVFHEILASLKRACLLDELFIPPALQDAMTKWEAGDPYAFNGIPYGHLMESVFLYGVSGSESVTGGMGLWGTTAMLSRLGAQIRLGVTPGTGGFYESIYLPMSLEVSPERVKEVVEAVEGGRLSV